RRPTPVIKNFLKFGGGLCAFLFAQVYLPAQVVLMEETRALIAAVGLKDLKSLSSGATLEFDDCSHLRCEDFNEYFLRVLPDHFIRQGLRLPDFSTQGMGRASPHARNRG